MVSGIAGASVAEGAAAEVAETSAGDVAGVVAGVVAGDAAEVAEGASVDAAFEPSLFEQAARAAHNPSITSVRRMSASVSGLGQPVP